MIQDNVIDLFDDGVLVARDRVDFIHGKYVMDPHSN